mmetsp:Transcript_6090/g.7004  ORF Transcript_6090/g.7004 Transcript_6090/m.7004 type:complete len:127 (-) Transcript_6090:505-885(-)
MDNILAEVGKFKKGNLKPTETKVSTLRFVVDTDPDEKIAKIRDFLFLGSAGGAGNLEELRTHEITHVLNLAGGYLENPFPDQLSYCTIEMLDLPDFDLLKFVEECNEFIDSAVEQNGRCLVHCNAG